MGLGYALRRIVISSLLWLDATPFTGAWSGLAHTFVSFELAGGRFLAISVEARRERGEDYALAASCD